MNKVMGRKLIALDIPLVSLLWPEGRPQGDQGGASWEGDLGLGDLSAALTAGTRYSGHVKQVLTTLIQDPAVIEWRQAVLADFLNNPALVEAAGELLPRLAHLQTGNAMLGRRQRNLLLDTADHLAELEAFVAIVQDLQAILSKAQLESAALRQLATAMGRLVDEPDFQTLRDELPGLRQPLEQVRSLTVGINLDLELKPISAVLLAINGMKFSGKVSWLERVLGADDALMEEVGLARLHGVPDDPNQRPLSQLFQDMDQLLTQVAQPISKALGRYARTGSGVLVYLEYELAYFTAAARMIREMEERGVVFCRPMIAGAAERVCAIEGLVNVGLALRKQAVVANDVLLGDEGRIAVLTGPNSGGKTTYLRSVGLAQVMFQAGLYVPARTARMSPVDRILTHFQALETRQDGRLAEEAGRLRKIFEQATATSLVLLNETFSSTSSGEAVYLAHDVLAGLRAIGARVIYATHLNELAERLDEIMAAAEGDCVLFSLVAGVEMGAEGEAKPTYRIQRGEPLGRSYAREIARRHGISLEQILAGRAKPRVSG